MEPKERIVDNNIITGDVADRILSLPEVKELTPQERGKILLFDSIGGILGILARSIDNPNEKSPQKREVLLLDIFLELENFAYKDKVILINKLLPIYKRHSKEEKFAKILKDYIFWACRKTNQSHKN